MRRRWVVGACVVASLGAWAGAEVSALPGAAFVASTAPSARTPPTRPDPRLRALIPFRVRYRDLLRSGRRLVVVHRIAYRANGGQRRSAYVVLPAWYSPRRHPAIPLVVAPHGRGISARVNLRFWRELPAFGPFALVSPEGQGRRLALYSWGWRGQIDDLARMPSIVEAALPGLRIDRRRVYAVGSSMGGQEALLLAALHPRLLAGVVAMDSATNMAARYHAFPQLRDGHRLQRLARIEIGGTPAQVPGAYARRSPLALARLLARAGIPIHLWWSSRDRIVRDQASESGALYRRIRAINPRAPVWAYVGAWAHSKEEHDVARLPLALVQIGLISLDEPLPVGVRP